MKDQTRTDVGEKQPGSELRGKHGEDQPAWEGPPGGKASLGKSWGREDHPSIELKRERTTEVSGSVGRRTNLG